MADTSAVDDTKRISMGPVEITQVLLTLMEIIHQTCYIATERLEISPNYFSFLWLISLRNEIMLLKFYNALPCQLVLYNKLGIIVKDAH